MKNIRFKVSLIFFMFFIVGIFGNAQTKIVKSVPPILVIDTNNVYTEIARIEAAIKKSGQNPTPLVTVLPNFTEVPLAKRKQVAQMNDHWKDVLMPKVTRSNITTDERNRFLDEALAYHHSIKKFHGYTVEKLGSDIDNLPVDTFEVVVISGHHAEGSINGEFFPMTIAPLEQLAESRNFEFGKAADRNPGVFSKVKVVILLGCFTGKPDVIDKWMSLFPNAILTLGAYREAPTRWDSMNLNFVENLFLSLINSGIYQRDFISDTKAREFLGQIVSSRLNWPVAIRYKSDSGKFVYIK